MKEQIKLYDIIFVDNPLKKEEHSYFQVYKIEGNKAHTKFRTFHRKIYPLNRVYEYGKRLNPYYNNGYFVLKPEEITEKVLLNLDNKK